MSLLRNGVIVVPLSSTNETRQVATSRSNSVDVQSHRYCLLTFLSFCSSFMSCEVVTLSLEHSGSGGQASDS